MTGQLWGVEPASENLPADNQVSIERLENSVGTWSTTLSIVVVFIVAVVTMMFLNGAGLSQFHAFALVGLIALLPYLVWGRLLTRFDPWTPRSAMVFWAMLWGSLPAVLIAVFVQIELDDSVAQLSDADLGLMLVAPVSEELSKGLFVALLYIFGRRHLRGPWDGLFLGAGVGAGFGFTEDIGYLMDSWQTDGAEGLAAGYVIREVFTAHAHLLFAACTGLAAGLAARRGLSTRHGLAWIGLGFLAAFALHAIWDGSIALLPEDNFVALLIAPLMLGIIYGLIAIIGLRFLRRWEDRILSARLSEYVQAGWFNAEDIASVADGEGRKAAIKRIRHMPANSRRATHLLYAAQTLLALNRQKALSGTPYVVDTEKENARLLNLVLSIRGSAGVG